MTRPSAPLDSALATLRGRWGSAIIRLGAGASTPQPLTHGALALAPVPDADTAPEPAPVASARSLAALPGALASMPGGTRPEGDSTPLAAPAPALALVAPGSRPNASAAPPGVAADPTPARGQVVSTGFPALDAILGPAGLPAEASAAIRGDMSSGKTTLALRCIAEAQAAGAIAAWLDLARAFDPLEAVGRGVDLRWLLVIRPGDIEEGFALGGALLSGRSVDLLVIDLPARVAPATEGFVRRLAAHARRTRARLLILEPTSLGASLQAAVGEAASLRLELERRAWLRLGQDIVGQRTEVTVSRNRYGPPGRRAALEIHYLADGERGLGTHRLAVHGLALQGGARAVTGSKAADRIAAAGSAI
jgi:RecA/RadA recombinase